VLTSVMIASLSLSALSLCAASMGRRSMLATVSPAGHTHSGTTGIHGVSMPMVTHSCNFQPMKVCLDGRLDYHASR
jgi:hypothetical protein